MTAEADAAFTAATRGWHVIPLRPNAKPPAFPNHGEGDACRRDPWCLGGHVGWEPRATTDTDRIRQAWNQRPYGVGIACGPSRIVVVDLDVPKPGERLPDDWHIPGVVDGHDVLATICEQAGEPLPLDTYTVTTPSGGSHLYFRHPESGPLLRNTAGGASGSLGPLVDTRAHGGYVVAAGTTIARKPYAVVCDVDPAPLPAWLAERLTPRALPPQRPVRINLPADRRGRYLRAAISRQLDHLAATPRGARNTALYRSAVALGQLAAGNALPEQDVTQLLTRAGLDAGLRPREVARTVASGLADGARRPRTVAA